jgi:hypothetical protein
MLAGGASRMAAQRVTVGNRVVMLGSGVGLLRTLGMEIGIPVRMTLNAELMGMLVGREIVVRVGVVAKDERRRFGAGSAQGFLVEGLTFLMLFWCLSRGTLI